MKLSDAAKRFEECFELDNLHGDGGCLYNNCPLHDNVEITSGAPYDEEGQIIWRIGGCTLMSNFEKWLKKKKPGTPYPKES